MITTLNLTNFRLHSALNLKFEGATNLIVGPNASGKTAIIEAIYLASTGDSFRAGRIDEMVQFNADLARVQVKLIKTKNLPTTLEVLLTRGLVQGKKTRYRLFSVNEVKKQKKNFVGQFQVILFRPEDMRLIEGSPGRRRHFLDQVLSHLFPDYYSSLKTYENTLKRRNRLLLAVREGEQPRSVLQFWNLSLIKNGQILQNYRQKLINSFNQANLPLKYRVSYLPKIINEKRQSQYLTKEIAAGYSLIGPHKDDFRVDFFQPDAPNPFLNVATYGSRGQQRLAVLWLKAAESVYRKKQTKAPLVWLLDDILSELDQKSRHLVLALATNHQVVITTADKTIEKLVKPEKLVNLNES